MCHKATKIYKRREMGRGALNAQGAKASISNLQGKIPDRVPIENKPALANTRQELGHWEADTAVSRQSKGAIAVLIERQTRLVKRYN